MGRFRVLLVLTAVEGVFAVFVFVFFEAVLGAAAAAAGVFAIRVDFRCCAGVAAADSVDRRFLLTWRDVAPRRREGVSEDDLARVRKVLAGLRPEPEFDGEPRP